MLPNKNRRGISFQLVDKDKLEFQKHDEEHRIREMKEAEERREREKAERLEKKKKKEASRQFQEKIR